MVPGTSRTILKTIWFFRCCLHFLHYFLWPPSSQSPYITRSSIFQHIGLRSMERPNGSMMANPNNQVKEKEKMKVRRVRRMLAVRVLFKNLKCKVSTKLKRMLMKKVRRMCILGGHLCNSKIILRVVIPKMSIRVQLIMTKSKLTLMAGRIGLSNETKWSNSRWTRISKTNTILVMTISIWAVQMISASSRSAKIRIRIKSINSRQSNTIQNSSPKHRPSRQRRNCRSRKSNYKLKNEERWRKPNKNSEMHKTYKNCNRLRKWRKWVKCSCTRWTLSIIPRIWKFNKKRTKSKCPHNRKNIW